MTKESLMVSARTPISQEIAGGRLRQGSAGDGVNVGDIERWVSLAGGGLLALYGLSNRSAVGLGLAALGGGLVYRGLTGHCPMYGALNINTAQKHNPAAAVGAGVGFKVVRGITINRPVEDLYRYWRNLESLPRVMSHLESVTANGNRSHWVAKGPAGMSVEWEAEIINEEPDRLIAWRSLEGSQVSTAGSVQFSPLGFDRGTEVRVSLKYDPPAGKLGSWLAWLFGEDPDQQIREDLRRFKQQMESGEGAALASQPSR
jgi:uncharacterized membrane protein